jgi:flavin-dependent dehydrogenase
MPQDSFDCVIVGARCAGAPLATHLARAGMKVCIIDSAKLPSDQPFSTHAIQPLGMDLLDELGVGSKVRERTPKVVKSRIAVGQAHLDFVLEPGREMYCPRRTLLDPLLQDAALAAGADLRPETTALELITEKDRVVGVRARHANKKFDLRAPIIVGADGRNSTIARLVRAEKYLTQEFPRGGYWTYWPITPTFEKLPFQTYIEIDGRAARFAFQCDAGLVIAGALDATAKARAWSTDIGANVRASLMRSEVIRLLVDANEPATSYIGLMKGTGFFRVPVGAGWALVGDAGLHKDPTPGYGITDALRDAKSLSRALLDGREAAFQLYWRERDVQSLPLFANANRMGGLDYGNPFNELIIDRVENTPALQRRVLAVIDRKISPFEMVPVWRVLAWTATALLKGRGEIWPHFLDSGKYGAWVNAELERRKLLLQEARRRLGATDGIDRS